MSRTSRKIIVRAVGLVLAALLSAGCGPAGPEVVVYTSVDEPFARPVLDAFARESGIRVLPVFDTEAAKTVGLARRLVAEKAAPRCDVFWSNEIVQTLFLKEQGVLAPHVPAGRERIAREFCDPEGFYTALGGRLRVLLVRPSSFAASGREPPRSVAALADPELAARAAMARPIAGTTLTHLAALCAIGGADATRAFFERAVENGIKILDGNALAKDAVVDREAAFCLTDSDDAIKGRERDPELEVVIPDQSEGGAVLIPGTVALIAGGPNPAEAKRLIDFLLSRAVAERLLASSAFQVALRTDGPFAGQPFDLAAIRCAPIDWPKLTEALAGAQKIATEIFSR